MNIITVSRIIGSFVLLFVIPQSEVFFAIYAFCGISDILDGFLARKFNVASQFGATLDSVADFIFVIIMLIIFIPILLWETWILVWIGTIIAIRLLSLMVGIIKYRKLAFIHTYANKMAGFMLFLFPFGYTFINIKVAVFVLCSIGLLSAVEELVIIVKSKALNKNTKSLFAK